MGLKQDIAGAEIYMARANRRIGKARHLVGRSPNEPTVAIAGELVEVLTALLANVERRHQQLQAETASAKKRP